MMATLWAPRPVRTAVSTPMAPGITPTLYAFATASIPTLPPPRHMILRHWATMYAGYFPWHFFKTAASMPWGSIVRVKSSQKATPAFVARIRGIDRIGARLPHIAVTATRLADAILIRSANSRVSSRRIVATRTLENLSATSRDTIRKLCSLFGTSGSNRLLG